MKVLLAVVSGGTNGHVCSLGFAVSMLRLQTALFGAPTPIQAVLEIVPSLRDAVDLAAKDETINALVAVSSNISFPAAFVLRALVSRHPFVAGIYPLPLIDWGRVKSKSQGDDVASTEKMAFRGNVYNLDASKAKFVGGGYLELAPKDVEPGAVVLSREAAEAIAKRAPSTDAEVPAAWGRPVHADVEHQCANFGSVEFMGCVGTRAVLR